MDDGSVLPIRCFKHATAFALEGNGGRIFRDGAADGYRNDVASRLTDSTGIPQSRPKIGGLMGRTVATKKSSS